MIVFPFSRYGRGVVVATTRAAGQPHSGVTDVTSSVTAPFSWLSPSQQLVCCSPYRIPPSPQLVLATSESGSRGNAILMTLGIGSVAHVPSIFAHSPHSYVPSRMRARRPLVEATPRRLGKWRRHPLNPIMPRFEDRNDDTDLHTAYVCNVEGCIPTACLSACHAARNILPGDSRT